ncbi:MAG TPA: diacylglycerol kinase family protein [Opitutaceae bacterium]
MKLRFIFNPCSGRPRRNAPLLPALREFISAQALDADLVCTEGPGHATEIARDAIAAGCERIVAVGGDGTVNEIAQAIIHSPVAMGLVPCGSGNGLALHLGLPTSPLRALVLAAGGRGRVAELDTGNVNGLPFVNAMGLGLDAEVGRRFNLLARRGLPAYVKTALAAFLARKVERCSVIVDGRIEAIDALLIAIANSDQYGNRAKIAPHARVDDGALDLVAVLPVGFAGACVLGARLFLGTIDRSPRVRRLKGARFLIERASAGIIHTDGEIHVAAATLEVAVRPRSLRVVVPAECAAVTHSASRSAAGFALQLP